MKNSKIAWTHHTFNPWIGCQRVSPGCQYCYAEAQDQRWRPGATRWGPTAPRTRTSASYWRQPLVWNRAAARAGTRARVFCASLADVFEDRAELAAWRLDLFRLIMQTPSLDWLLLTKRPENVRDALLRNVPVGDQLVIDWLWGWGRGDVVPPNVWLGTTVEDQRRADERIPALLAVPARVRFLSCEPLLEEVTVERWLGYSTGGGVAGHCLDIDGYWWHSPGTCKGAVENCSGKCCQRGIDWLIIGGESGPKARPFDVAWARSLIQQGRAAGAKVFMKQLGSRPVGFSGGELSDELWRASVRARAGEDPAEWPEDLRVREFPEVRT